MYALDQMGLANRAQHFPAELSGGEQQRVAIARAIVNHPKILVADEPTGNLDFETSREIMDILYEINANGTTILMATHDRGIVEKSHHRILTLDNGRLIGDDNLLAGYTIGRSNVQRNAEVLLEQAEQRKADRGFHAATEEIGRINSRLSTEDTKIKNTEIKQKPISIPKKHEVEKRILLDEVPTLQKKAEKQTEKKVSAEIKCENDAKMEKTTEMRAEQIKAVLEKSSNLKITAKEKPEGASISAKLTDNVLEESQSPSEAILNEASTESKTTSGAEDWERLILEAFK